MISVVKESLLEKGSLSATQNAKSSQSAEEVRSFSGLVEFYANFLPDLPRLPNRAQNAQGSTLYVGRREESWPSL